MSDAECESCGDTGDHVREYYMGDEDGYLGHPWFCDDCIDDLRDAHVDDRIELSQSLSQPLASITDTEDDPESGECPICGQPYDHKHQTSGGNTPRLRSDATSCRTSPLVGRQTMFVHLKGGEE